MLLRLVMPFLAVFAQAGSALPTQMPPTRFVIPTRVIQPFRSLIEETHNGVIPTTFNLTEIMKFPEIQYFTTRSLQKRNIAMVSTTLGAQNTNSRIGDKWQALKDWWNWDSSSEAFSGGSNSGAPSGSRGSVDDARGSYGGSISSTRSHHGGSNKDKGDSSSHKGSSITATKSQSNPTDEGDRGEWPSEDAIKHQEAWRNGFQDKYVDLWRSKLEPPELITEDARAAKNLVGTWEEKQKIEADAQREIQKFHDDNPDYKPPTIWDRIFVKDGED